MIAITESRISISRGLNIRLSEAHVVGGAGHDVADALAAVEGLALAEQADVELVARIALDALGQELERVVARQAGEALGHRCQTDAGGDRQQAPVVAQRLRCDQVEGAADQDLDAAVGEVVEDRRRDRMSGKSG